ncbi:hypothetical protein DFH08DRAFT_359003 [Mycena albidolilacea]|uniref:Uncharacterized protein n=1 Tax=Mycena albidolilacea TaxID=1033008 RepID=A0AAD7EZR4_9AGAR|nr:hypothetical protein DFH08DRAFT_359003 [Mycena albidolilacea]
MSLVRGAVRKTSDSTRTQERNARGGLSEPSLLLFLFTLLPRLLRARRGSTPVAFPSAHRPSAPSTPSLTKDPRRATPASHAHRRESTLSLVSWGSMYVQKCGKTNGEGKRCCRCRRVGWRATAGEDGEYKRREGKRALSGLRTSRRAGRRRCMRSQRKRCAEWVWEAPAEG